MLKSGQFVSSQEVSLAVNLSVCLFNDGWARTISDLMESLGMEVGGCSKEILMKLDKNRILQGKYRKTDERKHQRRTKKRMECKKQDGFLRSEGVHYSSHAFHKVNGKLFAK